MLFDLSRKNGNVINIHRYCEHTSSALLNMYIGTFQSSQKYNIITLFLMSSSWVLIIWHSTCWDHYKIIQKRKKKYILVFRNRKEYFHPPFNLHQIFRVKGVLCHHSMAHPSISDGGYGLKMWKVAANVLNKLLQTADGGSPAAWGLGGGLTMHFI